MNTKSEDELHSEEAASFAVQREFASLIEQFSSREGENSTHIAPLHLFHCRAPQELLHSELRPVVCLVAQGSKRVTLGEQTYVYDPTHFLLVTVELPVASQVVEATPEEPYLSVALEIDAGQIGALVAEMNHSLTLPRSAGRGIMRGRTDTALLDAFVRLVRLLKQPKHIDVLAPLVMREIFYLLLVGEQGDSLRRIALGQSEPGIVQALHWIKRNFAEPLRIENIARSVHMSPSAFHHEFKAVTAMTPLQYQKQLRLQEARRLLIEQDMDVAAAGLVVGYESATQFTREYRRLFGDPPRRDIARLRGSGPRVESV